MARRTSAEVALPTRDDAAVDDRDRDRQWDERPWRIRADRDPGIHECHAEVAGVASQSVRAVGNDRLGGRARVSGSMGAAEGPHERPYQSGARDDQCGSDPPGNGRWPRGASDQGIETEADPERAQEYPWRRFDHTRGFCVWGNRICRLRLLGRRSRLADVGLGGGEWCGFLVVHYVVSPALLEAKTISPEACSHLLAATCWKHVKAALPADDRWSRSGDEKDPASLLADTCIVAQ